MLQAILHVLTIVARQPVNKGSVYLQPLLGNATIEGTVVFFGVCPQGEAIHRKYKRLKLGGGQAYHRSSN
jgi:hypothetical protein